MSLTPVLALAQTTGKMIGCRGVELGTVEGIVCKVGDILNILIPILIALGVVFFIWGVIQYVVGGDEEAKKKGRDKMIYGIIGLAVIVALWGLVNALIKSFGVGGPQDFPYPTTDY